MIIHFLIVPIIYYKVLYVGLSSGAPEVRCLQLPDLNSAAFCFWGHMNSTTVPLTLQRTYYITCRMQNSTGMYE